MAKNRRLLADVDHGPVLLIHRSEIERDDRTDPDAPNRTIAGTRRRDGLRQMLSRGHLTDAEWTAAERFRDDLAFAAGARGSGGRGSSGSYGPGKLQIDAQTRVNGALRAVGLVLGGVLSWVVISHGTIDGYATCKRIRLARASEMLHAALDRLAVFYSSAGKRGVKPP